ncbi:MAG: hypothetical protein NVSMB55_01200 [Mycobacteriales bacterium]
MNTYDNIAVCAARYAEARDLLRASPEELSAYEAVLLTRVALAECLIASGWSPPNEMQQLLVQDRQLLAEPRGAIEREPVPARRVTAFRARLV